MKLFLLRHAKTETESATGEDFDRKLKPKGHEQCKLLNKYLTENYGSTSFDVHCSSARRTKATLTDIKEGVSLENVTYSKELYLADRKYLLNYLCQLQPTKNEVLLIGHNSGLSDVVSYLLEDFIQLPTAGFVVLDLNVPSLGEVTQGCATLVEEFYPVLV